MPSGSGTKTRGGARTRSARAAGGGGRLARATRGRGLPHFYNFCNFCYISYLTRVQKIELKFESRLHREQDHSYPCGPSSGLHGVTTRAPSAAHMSRPAARIYTSSVCFPFYKGLRDRELWPHTYRTLHRRGGSHQCEGEPSEQAKQRSHASTHCPERRSSSAALTRATRTRQPIVGYVDF